MLENIPEPSSESWKIVLTSLAMVGAVRAWFHKVTAKKLSIKSYELDKLLIAEKSEKQLQNALIPIKDTLHEVKFNLKNLVESQGLKYIKKDE